MSATCLPSFLLGVNLAFIFLEHNWGRHPYVLQKTGFTLTALVLAAIPLYTDAKQLPVLMFLWKDMGLGSPLFCLLIFYAARQQDYLTSVLTWPPLVFVGNSSYGMYLFQGLIWWVLGSSRLALRLGALVGVGGGAQG